MKMMRLVSIIIVLTLSVLRVTDAVICGGLFYMQRIRSSCVETTVDVTTDGSVSNNCFIFNQSQIATLVTNYTTYIDSATGQTYYAQIGAFTVLGTIDNYNLSYQCPPSGYAGGAPGCSTQPNTQLAVLKVNVLDGKLYGMDIILSGAPFPNPASLQDNKPPFGIARHIFKSGVTIQSTGYLKICKTKPSERCLNKESDAQIIPENTPGNTASGIFGIQQYNYVANSVWILDYATQLLITTAGPYHFYFNASGFFTYISGTNTCAWSAACNFHCEIYNYDSRFLDYAGDWVITKKWGVADADMKPTAVKAWIGNPMDATGVFPSITYTDKNTGYYRGMDIYNNVTIPSSKTGQTYWYTNETSTIPKTSIQAFHPNVVEAGCTTSLSQWLGF